MKTVQDAAKEIRRNPEVKALPSKLAITQTKLKNKCRELNTNVELLQKVRGDVNTAIGDIRGNVNDMLNDLEKAVKSEMESCLIVLAGKLRSDIDKCEQFDVKINRHLEDIENIKDQSERFIFQCLKTCEKQLKTVEDTLPTMQDGVFRLKFIPDHKFQKYLSSLQTLGKFYVTPKDLHPMHVYSVRYCRSEMVKTKGELLLISGMCKLSSEHIAIVDHFNRKIKLLSSEKYSVLTELDLPQFPKDVCATNEMDLVVTQSDQESKKGDLCFISVTFGLLACTKTVAVDHACYGITFKNGYLYVGSENAIYLYDLSGQKVVKFYEDMTCEGNTVSRFAVSDDGKRIYVTNSAKGSLITLTDSGDEISTFTDPELIDPRGVCVADNGTIFVCGWKSDTILQVDREGKRKMATLTKSSHRIYRPLSLCYYSQTKQMFVGQEMPGKLLELRLE